MKSFEDIISTDICKDDVDIELVMAGVNRNYHCQTKQNDFFVRYSPLELHHLEQIQFESSVLRRARDLGLPVCHEFPVAGRTIYGPYHIDGTYYHAFLTQTVYGDSLECKGQDVEIFAKALAKFHTMPIDGLSPPQDEWAVIRDYLNRGSFSSISNKIKAMEDALTFQPPGSNMIIHGDAWIGNALMTNDEAVLFDLEYTRIGPAEYDIATFLWALKAEQPHLLENIFCRFLKGYRCVRDWTFDPELINRYLLEKELRNLYFMSRFIKLTPEIAKQVAIYAEETIQFVEDNQIGKFLTRAYA